jgi:hypothetical protein
MMDDDQLAELTSALRSIANAITPCDAMPYRDDDGGVVTSVTEAMITHANAMIRISYAINDLAQAIREGHDA